VIDFLIKYFKGNNKSHVLLHVLFDVCALFGSFFMSAIFFGEPGSITNGNNLFVIMVSVFTAILVLIVMEFYKIIVRYSTARAAIPVAAAVFISSILASILSLFFDSEISITEIVVYGLCSFVIIFGVRYLYRELLIRLRAKHEIRVIIYGAGEAGRQFLNSLSSTFEYRAIAFIDDSSDLRGRSIGGLKVFDQESIGSLITRFNIDVVALVIPSISRERRRDILSKLGKFDVEVRVVPGLEDLLTKPVDSGNVKPVSIYDILGRIPVPPKQELISQPVRGMVVMVTGAGGSIGSEICRQVMRNEPASLILFELSEYLLYSINKELIRFCSETSSEIRVIPIIGSVQDRSKMRSILQKFKVDTVFHAAAYKHVPLVEQNITEGVKNNVFGTKAVVEASIAAGVSLVTLISTDKAVRPTNIMGASKRMAEFVCSALAGNGDTKISMVRFGNVMGSSGSVVPLFEQQILTGGPVTVTHPDVTRFFMTISEAAQLVIQASSMAKGGEVYLLDMGEAVKIVDLAVSMIKLNGKKPFFADSTNLECPSGAVEIIFTGLRPGEKLYEELLVNNQTKKTAHPLIMSAIESRPDNEAIGKYLKLLEVACSENDVEAIRDIFVDSGTGLNHDGNIVDYSFKGLVV